MDLVGAYGVVETLRRCPFATRAIAERTAGCSSIYTLARTAMLPS